ncbi:helix-turn-helix domain-containing protein [Chryseobacterium populi]|uniref:HTH cro/C1-type domain-containing protein n=1 Tax=Chryseobacterium populi TaxID=1144316 RepID=J3CGV3_9FLAO|nr:helix-turn-helix domain-containing protein [Chryseobacterium populi]EJL71414.1 hypothetical protein PMI13_02362 [Chryseobacterium populi]
MKKHLGTIIFNLVKEKQMDPKDFASQLAISEADLERIYQNSSLDLDTLAKIYDLLGSSLLLHYFDEDQLKNVFINHFSEKDRKRGTLAHKQEEKDEQLTQLKALAESLKKIISLYETKELMEKLSQKE